MIFRPEHAEDISGVCLLTAHNWENGNRVFLTCPCNEIYKDKAVGLKKMQICLKNYDLREYVEFGAF